MGAVYLARHTTLGRTAAVKVLLPEYSNNREIVTRFFNEARAATAIRHPGIVEVYDFGFLEDQLAYLIMEYLEGESLGARLRRGPLAVVSALSISRGIARALQAAHEKGVVHRDLKPDNVFLVPDEDARSGERIKLLDFGIAKLAFNAAEAGATRPGTVIGTPTYMAPEQCRGTTAVDLRADLYSLGCVIYEMLSGRPPFVADGAADVLAHHLYFEPKPLSTLRPDVPPPLERLVMALLAKAPARRPAGASDVVKLVDSIAVAQGVSGVTSPSGVDRAASVFGPPHALPTTLSGAASSRGGRSAPHSSAADDRVRGDRGVGTRGPSPPRLRRPSRRAPFPRSCQPRCSHRSRPRRSPRRRLRRSPRRRALGPSWPCPSRPIRSPTRAAAGVSWRQSCRRPRIRCSCSAWWRSSTTATPTTIGRSARGARRRSWCGRATSSTARARTRARGSASR
jgi:serine/threonine protein kinase